MAKIFGPMSSRPVDAVVGTIFIDEATEQHYVYDDGAWQTYPGAAPETLPKVTVSDAGKALTVNASGKWAASAIPAELPAVTVADAGKVLTVSAEGKWVAAALPE